MNQYKVTLYGSEDTRQRMEKKLNRYFRRRGASDIALNEGEREVTLRNGTLIRLKSLRPFGAWRDPFIEMEVTATEKYIERSRAAMCSYAFRAGLNLDVSVEQIKR